MLTRAAAVDVPMATFLYQNTNTKFKKKKNLDEHEALQCKYSLTLVLPHYGALREHIRGFYNNKE